MKNLRPLLSVFVLLSLITGLLYPLLVTALSKTLFPAQSAGSLIYHNNQLLGSSLIGQSFSSPQYFWSRPSATAEFPNNALASGGSNLGPTNPALSSAVAERIATLKAAHPQQTGAIPLDLVSASGSGLDPHISPAAAIYQASRVAQARNKPLAEVEQLIKRYTEAPQWGLFGEARVNVLLLNLALDGLK